MELLLHDSTRRQLEQAAVLPSGTYLFHGARHTGKATAARQLASRLNPGTEVLSSAGNHPNLIIVEPTDKASITIDQVRSLHGRMALKAYEAGGQRVVLIDQAQNLTVEAQNALLKLCEEPPLDTVIILCTLDTTRLLPTILSRAQPVYFPPLPQPNIESYLVANAGVTGVAAGELAEFADGAVGLALLLAEDNKQLEAYRTYDELAGQLLELSIFDRLVAARQLIDSKAPMPVLIGRLQHRLRTALRDGAAGAELQLARMDAVLNYMRRTSANVTPRMALECLMLEL